MTATAETVKLARCRCARPHMYRLDCPEYNPGMSEDDARIARGNVDDDHIAGKPSGRYVIRYNVAVYAYYDADEDRVTSVNVDDENIGEPVTIERTETYPDGRDPRALTLAERAAVVALLDELDWPVWEFGW
jgi:hypothetical protein